MPVEECQALSLISIKASELTKRPPMVRALHGNDILLFGSMSCKLDCRFHGFGARIPEEERIQRLVWHHRKELLHQVDVRLLKCDVDLAMHELANLCLCRLGDGRVAVAEISDADAAGEVQVFPATHH